MADILDAAGVVEQLQREAAIARARSRVFGKGDVGPEMIDGVACCRECGEPIPAARLVAMPDVALCVDCTVEVEGLRRVD